MENRLRKLIESNNETNRYEIAKRWKSSGGLVAATLCSYVPREVLYAAGVLPWRVTGTWSESIPHALIHRATWSSPRSSRILELVLKGDLDFVDMVIGTDWDIDLKRLWDEWVLLKKPRFSHIMFIPRGTSRLHINKMYESITKLITNIEAFTGIQIKTAALQKAIDVYSQMRMAIRQVYELRKRDFPALSGAEVLGITTAAFVLPPDEFNAELNCLLPYLQTRKAPLLSCKPRILVSSDFMDDLRYLNLVESLGCVVAMDDFDTGSRYFWMNPTNCLEPAMALAQAYLERPSCPRMEDWNRQIGQITEWLKDFKIDGVLELRLNYSLIRHFRTPYFRSVMEKTGKRFLSVPREHHFTNEAQLRTRIGAFIELLT